MDKHQYDLCIIGGGINGAGIARDAAGRGLSVLLLEQGDLACGTSSASSKMIHGGLRYLEFFDFGLVRKSLAEREIMMAIAPEIVRPLEFCIPHQNTIRPAWMVRLGLFIYDNLWRRKKLPASGSVNLRHHKYGHALKENLKKGFTYADCWVDDARLVILNAVDAANYGAKIKTYTRCTAINRCKERWNIETLNILNKSEETFSAKIVINATGPYAYDILEKTGHVLSDTPRLRLVQGAHIIVPKLYDGDQAYMLQLPDKRVMFVFPYGEYSMCGTTETDFYGDPVESAATLTEKKYLCHALNNHFIHQTSLDDIVWSFAGVRPLFEDTQTDTRKISRDYRFYEDKTTGALLLSVFGGKLTTYRVLSEQVMDILKQQFPHMKGSWTGKKPLPKCPVNFKKPPNDDDLRYFIKTEWARTAEDILWRRSKWGIHLSKEEIRSIKERTVELVKEIVDGNAQ